MVAMASIGQAELWVTLGPSSLGREAELLSAGATGVRLTFSYGTAALQIERAKALKRTAAEIGRRCLIVADLPGEKWRLGRFEGAATISLRQGTRVEFTLQDVGSPDPVHPSLPVSSHRFFECVRVGDCVIVGDGAAAIDITSVTDKSVLGEMASDGVINQTRGLTVRGTAFEPSSMMPRDVSDLEEILACEYFDCVAVSFVSRAVTIAAVRKQAEAVGRQVAIVAKIETRTGVDEVGKIAQIADCVMAARGDLAFAVPWVELPEAVAQIANAARAAKIPWILATQVAEGLDRQAIPTRAEVCDLAHWREVGCSGVLLSSETAFGRNAVEAVRCTAAMLARWRSRL